MNLVPRRIFLDDFFDDFMPSVPETNMKCDIYEKDNQYFLEFDLPGFDRKDINIDVDSGYLTISASKENNNNVEEKNYIRKERSYSKMSRSFYIGDANESDVKASFKDGILKIIVPKVEKQITKKTIEIE